MMRLPSFSGSAWAAAAALALLPVLVVAAGDSESPVASPPSVAPLSIVATSDRLDPGRPMFAGSPDLSERPEDRDPAPLLLGVVGRLSADAVALVRTRDGAVRTMVVGTSADGWQLGAVAPDAALFVRGERRVRAELPLAGVEGLPSN